MQNNKILLRKQEEQKVNPVPFNGQNSKANLPSKPSENTNGEDPAVKFEKEQREMERERLYKLAAMKKDLLHALDR